MRQYVTADLLIHMTYIAAIRRQGARAMVLHGRILIGSENVSSVSAGNKTEAPKQWQWIEGFPRPMACSVRFAGSSVDCFPAVPSEPRSV